MATLKGSNTAVSMTLSPGTIAITVPVDCAAGDVIVIGTNRGAATGNQQGVASITGAGTGNTGWVRGAHSTRSNTHDINIHILKVVNPIAAGTTLTITHNTANNRKTAILAVFSGTTGELDAHSNTAAPGVADTNVGSQGSSATPSSTTTAAVTENNCLVVGVTSLAGTATATANTGEEIAEASTTAGSSDRGLMMQWLNANAAGTKTISATNTASAGWAAAVITIPNVSAPTPEYGSVIIGGAKKDVANMSVIIGGVKKTVTNVSVIVGGVKKPLT
jgi:hypothetical protein